MTHPCNRSWPYLVADQKLELSTFLISSGSISRRLARPSPQRINRPEPLALSVSRLALAASVSSDRMASDSDEEVLEAEESPASTPVRSPSNSPHLLSINNREPSSDTPSSAGDDSPLAIHGAIKVTTGEAPNSAATARRRSNDSTSDDSDSDAPPLKRSCTAGSLLKDILLEGGKILQLAAAKADELAEETASASDVRKRTAMLEERMKMYHRQTKDILMEIKAAISSLQEMTSTMQSMLEKIISDAENSNAMKKHSALDVKLDRILTQLEVFSEKTTLLDFQDLSFNVEHIHWRLNGLERMLDSKNTPSSRASEELSPWRTDDDRCRGQKHHSEKKEASRRYEDVRRIDNKRHADSKGHSKNENRSSKPCGYRSSHH